VGGAILVKPLTIVGLHLAAMQITQTQI